MMEALVPSLILFFAGVVAIIQWKNMMKILIGFLSIELSIILLAAVLLSNLETVQWIIIVLTSLFGGGEAALISFMISLARRFKIENIDELSSMRG
ncbi:MAG: hypothetical protein QXT53_04170 [Ignisphaera sp.]